MESAQDRAGAAVAPPADTHAVPAWWKLAGVAMFVHAGANLGIRIYADTTEHTWWLSNVSHALAAVGLMLGSRAILSVALCATLVPHAIWIIDNLAGNTLGVFPFGFTTHTQHFGAVMWFVTSYHYYLLPTLLLAIAPGRRFVPEAARWTPALYALLLAFSLLLPEASNVNYAYAFAPRASWSASINTMPHALYLVGNLVSVMVLGMLPAWLIGRRWWTPGERTLRLPEKREHRRAA